MKKKIIIGDINETYKGTPIQIFNTARYLTSQSKWTIKTNNPQFVEALEVLNLHRINEIQVYLRLQCKEIEIDFQTAYNYLGEIYDIINTIRFYYDLNHKPITKNLIVDKIKEYNTKYMDMVKE